MIRVRLLVGRASLSGPEHIGHCLSVSPDEAKRMVDAGHAELVRDGIKPEFAMKAANPEKAAKRRGK